MRSHAPVALLSSALVACSGAALPRGNVVLVTLDTVRADHLGAYGYGAARTPEIDGLAARSVVFETALSVAPVTLPTHASILTGQYPPHHGVRNNGAFRLAPGAQTLAEQFAADGYDTAAVVSAMVLDSKFGLDQGFRVYDDDLYAGPPKKMFMFKEVRAEVSIDKAIALLDGELREPFFLWVHLFDAHADYAPPAPYDVLFLDQPYDGEIAYLDAQVGRLLDALRPVEDRTVVALTADHGDSLGDHGEQAHGIFVYRSTTHVPLIVSVPGVEPARVADVVSQVDVAPTLTDLVGVERLGTDGVSLARTVAGGRGVPRRDGVYLESLNPRFQFGWSELRAIDDGRVKYVDAPSPELYDLVADPGETANRWAGESDLARVLARWTEGDDLDALSPSAIDAETREMLEALGYSATIAAVSAGAERPDPKDVAHRWIDLQVCHALLREGLDERGAACLEAIVASDPQHVAARLSLAGAWRALGRYPEAIALLEGLLVEDPNNRDALLALAETLERAGRAAEAIEALGRAAAGAPGDPEPWVRLGDLHSDAGRTEDAIRAYGEALRRDEILVAAYVGLGHTFHQAGQSGRAVEYLEKATALEPTNFSAWYDLGVVHDQLGHTDDSLAAYARALEIDPDNAMAHNNLGSVLKREGRTDEAERHFRRALEIDPDHVEAKYNLGSLLIDAHPEQAVRLLAEVVAARPDLAPARHNLAVGLVRLDRIDDAIAQYTWLADNGSTRAGACLAIASLEAKRGRTSEARRYVRLAVEAGGDDARTAIARDPALAALGG